MTSNITRTVLFWTLGFAGSSFGVLSSQADTLYLQSGRAVQGEIQSFDGNRYWFFLEGETVSYGADEIRRFTIQRSTQPLSFDQILERLDRVEYKIDILSQTYQSSSANMQQKLFALNPVSQVYVLTQNHKILDDGILEVRGRLVNESYEWVRNFKLQANLFDTFDNIISTVHAETLAREIGPGGTKSFKIRFPDPPDSIGRVEIIPYLPTRSKDQDIGGYQRENPSIIRPGER